MTQLHLLGRKYLSCFPVRLGLGSAALGEHHPQSLVERLGLDGVPLGDLLQPRDSYPKPLPGPWNSIQDTLFLSFFEGKQPGQAG